MIIVGVLAATIIPKFIGTTHDAKVSACRRDIAVLQGAMERFNLDMDRYPSTEEGLKALVSPPADPQRWRGPYIDRLRPDPWKNPYGYRSPGLHTRTYDLWSRGADGADGGEGPAADITSWED